MSSTGGEMTGGGSAVRQRNLLLLQYSGPSWVETICDHSSWCFCVTIAGVHTLSSCRRMVSPTLTSGRGLAVLS